MGVFSYLKKPSAFLWRAFSPSRDSPDNGDNDSEEADPKVARKESEQPAVSSTLPLVIQIWEQQTAANRQRAEQTGPITIPSATATIIIPSATPATDLSFNLPSSGLHPTTIPSSSSSSSPSTISGQRCER